MHPNRIKNTMNMLQITEQRENYRGEIEGTFFSKCFSKKMQIAYDKNLSFEYINKAMKEYPDVKYKEGLYHLSNNLDILNYIEFGDIKVQTYDDDVVLNISGGCDWSDEGCLQWIIQGNSILYVGPWDDFETWCPDLNNPLFNYCVR